METHRERVIPVMLTGLFYYLGFIILQRLHLPSFMLRFVIGSMGAVILAFVISYWWKISLHLIGIGGVTGVLLSLSIRMGLGITPSLIAMIVMAAIVATARLHLNAHTPSQTMSGYVLGLFMVTIVTLM